MLRVRPATPDDVPALVPLVQAMRLLHGDLTGNFDAKTMLCDGFGPSPAFRLLVGFMDNVVAGYSLYHDAYEPSHAARGAYIADLYVDADARRRGLGRQLVATVARDIRDRGGCFLWWVAQPWNEAAQTFYGRLGASGNPVTANALAYGSFETLAGFAADGGVVATARLCA